MIYTAELDPLRDDGAAYAKALLNASVPVKYQCAKGLIHGFFDWVKYSTAASVTTAMICKDFKETLER